MTETPFLARGWKFRWNFCAWELSSLFINVYFVKLNLWKLWNAFVLILIAIGSTRVKYATIAYHITNLRNISLRITSHHMINDICSEHRCQQYNTIRAMVRGALGASKRLTLVLTRMIKLIWTMVIGLILVSMRTSQDHQSHGF